MGGSTNICPNITGGTPPYTFNWSPAISLNSSVLACPTAAPSTNTNYSVTVSDANGCIAVATSSVTVISLPTPVASNNGPHCEFNTIQLNCSNVGLNYLWAGPNAFFSTSQNPTINMPLVINSGTYTVSATDANGCTGNATTTVLINGSPIMNTTQIVEPSCGLNNGVTDLTANGGTSPYVFNLQPCSGGALIGPISQGYYFGPTAGCYTVTVSDANNCLASTIIQLIDSCDLVWPGDANDDLIADNTDLLAIALGNGTFTGSRNNQTINWIGIPARITSNTILGTSLNKHIDCNGDGIINLNDTIAVIQNFNLTHIASKFGNLATINGGNSNLKIDVMQDTLTAGATGNISILLGDALNNTNNIYGIAFTINFDPSYVDPASFHINGNGSWMGTQNTNMMCLALNDGNNGIVQAVVTRYDQTNISGYGQIANMNFTMKNNFTTTQSIPISLTNISLIDKTNNNINVGTINDSIVALNPLLQINTLDYSEIKIFPNPTKENVTLLTKVNSTIEIFDVSGNIVNKTVSTSNKTTIVTQSLNSGIYFIYVTEKGGRIYRNKLIIE
jgi:hypothetical protein